MAILQAPHAVSLALGVDTPQKQMKSLNKDLQSAELMKGLAHLDPAVCREFEKCQSLLMDQLSDRLKDMKDKLNLFSNFSWIGGREMVREYQNSLLRFKDVIALCDASKAAEFMSVKTEIESKIT